MGNFLDELIARHEPWLTDDLQTYLQAISTMVEELELYLGDDEEYAWAILFDPDRCPVKALPYLAQYVGERLPTGISEAAAREWIKDNPNAKRGTLQSIFLAAQRHLTGDRVVAWWERSDGVGTIGEQEDHLLIRTLTDQTPSEGQTLTDILSVTPADIEVHYDSLAGQTWADVAAIGTWTAVDTAYDSWSNLASDQDWPDVFSRPAP
jgi:hypothetical protein